MIQKGLFVSVIVCTHNRYEYLRRAIEALFAQEMNHEEYEIIVVDNSADHQLAAAFESEYSQSRNFRYVYEPVLGLSRARNRGAELAKAPIIAYIDDDAIASAQWLQHLVAAYEQFGEKTAVVGGRVRPIWLSPRPDWLNAELEAYLSIIDRGNECRELLPDEWLAGCNLSFRREFLLATGGFPTNLGRAGDLSLLSNEEDHVIRLIRASGGKIIYAPAATVDHYIDPNRTQPEWVKRRIAWQAVSDALSQPDESLRKAKIVSGRFEMITRYGRAVYFSNILNRKKRVDAIDQDRIYNTILVLLCRGG